MAKRERATVTEPKAKNSYFTTKKEKIKFISSGCAVLDCALGGGFALGRTVNVVGDKSTSKTGLATEALINFLHSYPDGRAAYRETEAAYDPDYAAAMGLPVDKIDFGKTDSPLITVEDFYNDFNEFCDEQLKAKKPGIYVLDSLDALSDQAEVERDIDKGSYGGAKAKKMSEMFRKMTRKQEQANVLLFIVSQVRDNIGVMFGEKHTRSGGKALDFYASQILWLAHIKILKRTVNKVERPYGIEIRAKVKKNKVGLPLREADYTFEFGFGINDLLASVDWLKEVDRLEDLTDRGLKGELDYIKSLDDEQYAIERKAAARVVTQIWAEIEEGFLPKRKKYA
jgi:recombination protein RecA